MREETNRNAPKSLYNQCFRALSPCYAKGTETKVHCGEYFFKSMRAEFALDTLPEHALVDVDEDAWVVNPAWRVIDKALR